jgi:structural maintenance of chromosome 4
LYLPTAYFSKHQPGGEVETVPGSTIVVARKAFKNNASQYSINGRNSNYTEVTTMLREKGIDLDHKRFLILQVTPLVDKTDL